MLNPTAFACTARARVKSRTRVRLSSRASKANSWKHSAASSAELRAASALRWPGSSSRSPNKFRAHVRHGIRESTGASNAGIVPTAHCFNAGAACFRHDSKEKRDCILRFAFRRVSRTLNSSLRASCSSALSFTTRFGSNSFVNSVAISCHSRGALLST